MISQILCFVIILFLNGCAVTFETSPSLGQTKEKVKDLLNINQLRVGMTTSEVKALLGQQLKIGYQQSATDAETPEPIFLKNPVKQESLEADKKTYQVLYYYTSIHKADDILSDEELTPLIFYNDKLVGIGSDYLLKLKSHLIK